LIPPELEGTQSTMTIGIDLVAAVVGLIAIFAHLFNKVRRLVKLSRRILELQLEHLGFQRKIAELARAARQNLPAHRREMLDDCIRMCQENYSVMEAILLKIQASRFKHGRALLESSHMRQLQKASEASTERLKYLLDSNQ
jgi:hypothetical protein